MSKSKYLPVLQKHNPKVKSHIPVTRCVLGLANVTTWDEILNKIGVRKAEIATDKANGKRKVTFAACKFACISRLLTLQQALAFASKHLHLAFTNKHLQASICRLHLQLAFASCMCNLHLQLAFTRRHLQVAYPVASICNLHLHLQVAFASKHLQVAYPAASICSLHL
ncbi:hypothetical protein Tco_1296230 [Tanacetum coccineum]